MCVASDACPSSWNSSMASSTKKSIMKDTSLFLSCYHSCTFHSLFAMVIASQLGGVKQLVMTRPSWNSKPLSNLSVAHPIVECTYVVSGSFRAIVVCAWGEKGAAASDSEGKVCSYTNHTQPAPADTLKPLA